ncbi:MAG TPA: metallophosphoesterase [Clostridia bacterium]|nr:metallophosphoesterase [Clostridia bacterium]
MNIINTIKKIFGSIIYDDSIDHEGVKVLHITDTPTTSYGAIINLIEALRPDYIIHTGDLADNIKLEIYPEKIDLYNKKVRKFLLNLESFDCERYIVIGNHDNPVFIKKALEGTQVVETYKAIRICNRNFLITHKLDDILNEEKLIQSSDYILHGHSFYDVKFSKHIKVLNGLEGIYLIYPETNRIYQIEYPIGTNDSRMQRFGTGI